MASSVAAWPAGATRVQAFVEAVARAGAEAFCRNLHAQMLGLAVGPFAVPLTVSAPRRGNVFLVSPRAGFVDYAREAAGDLRQPWARAGVRLAASAFSGLLAAAGVERMVQVNNWLLTSQHAPAGLAAHVADLTAALLAWFPHRALVWRTLNPAAHRPIMEALAVAGWRLVPVREIWLNTCDEARARQFRDERKDLKLLARSEGLTIAAETALTSGDYHRIAELYQQLYVDRHSPLNPHYTPAFFALADQIGLLRLVVARGGAGAPIVGFYARWAEFGWSVTPAVGYDRGDPAHGARLYRLLMAHNRAEARRQGLTLNQSSGVGQFKAARGAIPALDYAAVHVGGLRRGQRAAFAVTAALADRIVGPASGAMGA